jgi:hypothetical protein
MGGVHDQSRLPEHSRASDASPALRSITSKGSPSEYSHRPSQMRRRLPLEQEEGNFQTSGKVIDPRPRPNPLWPSPRRGLPLWRRKPSFEVIGKCFVRGIEIRLGAVDFVEGRTCHLRLHRPYMY